MIAGKSSTILFSTQIDLPREGSNFERERAEALCEYVADRPVAIGYLWVNWLKISQDFLDLAKYSAKFQPAINIQRSLEDPFVCNAQPPEFVSS